LEKFQTEENVTAYKFESPQKLHYSLQVFHPNTS